MDFKPPLLKRCMFWKCIVFLVLSSSVNTNAQEEVHQLQFNPAQRQLSQLILALGDAQQTLRCTADDALAVFTGNLVWVVNSDTNFTSTSSIILDVSNPKDITISFPQVDYSITGDYFCQLSTSGTTSGNSTTDTGGLVNFKVFVEAPRSTWTSIFTVLFLVIFVLLVAYFYTRF